MSDSAPPKGRMSPRVLAVLVLIAVCAMGVAAGVVLDRAVLRQHADLESSYRDRFPRWARSESEHRQHWDRLAKRLKLTPGQATAVDSILAQQARQLRSAREEVDPRMWAIMKMTRQRIDSVLTQDQKTLMQALRREHELKRERQ
jgi:hypothetical protein